MLQGEKASGRESISSIVSFTIGNFLVLHFLARLSLILGNHARFRHTVGSIESINATLNDIRHEIFWPSGMPNTLPRTGATISIQDVYCMEDEVFPHREKNFQRSKNWEYIDILGNSWKSQNFFQLFTFLLFFIRIFWMKLTICKVFITIINKVFRAKMARSAGSVRRIFSAPMQKFGSLLRSVQ